MGEGDQGDLKVEDKEDSVSLGETISMDNPPSHTTALF
jgi:hypothetical protein